MAWNKFDDEIINYLSGELSQSEKEAFEKRLSSDPDLARAMERHREFETSLVEYSEFKSDSNQIQKLNQQFSKNQKRRKYIGYILVAAVVLSLIGVIFLNQKKTVCAQEVFAWVFVPISLAPEYAGQGLDGEQILQMAHSRYNVKNYPDAAKFYQQAIDSKALSPLMQDEAYFFLGQVAMIERNFAKAQDIFSKIQNNPYLEQSIWFNGLALMELGRMEESKPIFEKISVDEVSDYQDEATLLLDQWDRIRKCD